MSDFHFSPRPNRAAEIGWRAWGDEPFAESKATGKPVLLAISAVWCHWCHVMDETTYSNSAVIDLINARFVPVRVDNDRRPDINARYNMGGWPTTAILSPEGEVIHGGTYIPPDAMHRLLSQIEQYFAEPDNRLELAERIAELQAVRARRPVVADPGPLDRNTTAVVFSFLEDRFDAEFGGFGDEPKFPQTGTLQYLMDFWARTKDARAETMILKSLRGMAGGGMYDHVEGGFFRYSTTRDFSVPHFEKMLEDLAGLLLACARSHTAFGADDLGRVAIDVKRYIDERLWQPTRGAYGGSQDADEAYFARDAAARAELPAPYVDPTIYTSWNAEMANALLLAAPLLSDLGIDADSWNQRGIAVLETLWSRLLDHGLMCRYLDDGPHIRGLFGDQAWCAAGALAAHAATGDCKWLARAGSLIDASDALFDEQECGYLDRLPGRDDPGRLASPAVPFNENALMARVLLSYGSLTGYESYERRARIILGRFRDEYRRYEVFAAGYASAVLDALEPPTDAVIVGTPRAAQALRNEALKVIAPMLRINCIDPSVSSDIDRLQRLGYVPSQDGDAVAYLCRDKACFARATATGEFTAALA